MTDPTASDPRPGYRAALTWVADLMAQVPADRMSAPTPCNEFDVRALMQHLLGTVGRAQAVAEGRPATSAPSSLDAPDLAAAYARAADHVVESWSDDALLDAPTVVPWGEAPGRGALAGYVQETLVHGWDLAVATGQDAEADPAVVEPCLAAAPQFLPAEIRAEEWVPFDAPVQPRLEAGPTERLANWSGRSSTGWV